MMPIPPTVAALYVDPRGPYPHLPGVECWGLPYRDAKTYAGPHPVVAHPPCGPWSKLRHLCTKQDAECAKVALEQVREFGGVLEHPEHSLLWEWDGMPLPGGDADEYGGRTYRVEQVWWGHACVKPTWLYAVRIDWGRAERSIHEAKARGGTATHCVCTGPGQKQRLPVASKPVKRRTPPSFAELLVSLARSAADSVTNNERSQ